MWVRTFQFARCLQAHEQQFPVGSSAALGKGEGAGGQASKGQGEREREAPMGWNTRQTDGKKKTRSQFAKLSVVAEAASTTACTTQLARSSGGTCEAHLAASSKKAWQGLAGVGRQLKREGGGG